jgi:hypothetical protein
LANDRLQPGPRSTVALFVPAEQKPDQVAPTETEPLLRDMNRREAWAVFHAAEQEHREVVPVGELTDRIEAGLAAVVLAEHRHHTLAKASECVCRMRAERRPGHFGHQFAERTGVGGRRKAHRPLAPQRPCTIEVRHEQFTEGRDPAHQFHGPAGGTHLARERLESRTHVQDLRSRLQLGHGDGVS